MMIASRILRHCIVALSAVIGSWQKALIQCTDGKKKSYINTGTFAKQKKVAAIKFVLRISRYQSQHVFFVVVDLSTPIIEITILFHLRKLIVTMAFPPGA